MIAGGTARAPRAALFALVCTATGTALHQLADGCRPGLLGPMLALPLLWLAAFALARRERHTVAVTLALAVAQLALHLELCLFCPPMAPAPGMPDMSNMPGAPEVSALPHGHGAAAMLLAHTLAVLVCGWWLGRGERAFFDLCRLLRSLVARTAAALAGFAASAAPVLPTAAARRFQATARRTAAPPDGPAPGPRILRGPPLSPTAVC